MTCSTGGAGGKVEGVRPHHQNRAHALHGRHAAHAGPGVQRVHHPGAACPGVVPLLPTLLRVMFQWIWQGPIESGKSPICVCLPSSVNLPHRSSFGTCCAQPLLLRYLQGMITLVRPCLRTGCADQGVCGQADCSAHAGARRWRTVSSASSERCRTCASWRRCGLSKDGRGCSPVAAVWPSCVM